MKALPDGEILYEREFLKDGGNTPRAPLVGEIES
jgi:hypothetical protein